MKKALVTLALTLVVVSSLVAGTLAMYTTTHDDFANNTVEAKEFTVVTTAEDNFTGNVQIAPGETVKMVFTVNNFKGTTITETEMDLDIKVTLKEAAGKKAIVPLKFSVTKDSAEVGTLANGVISIKDNFKLSAIGQTYTYTVVVEWPNGTPEIDNQYIGSEFGSAVSVSLVGTQVVIKA
ncbi:MAG: hypothetical protein RSA24_03970 [Clostridia bacterium]